jgi:hypothetical protein
VVRRSEGSGAEPRGGVAAMSFMDVTKGSCDRCGVPHERPGAEGPIPPPMWSRVVLTTRSASDRDSGWTNSTAKTVILCPGCTAAIRRML